MSHSSGIPVSADLDTAFANARTEGGVRWLKIVVRDDQLVAAGVGPLGASFEEDFPSIADQLLPKAPCYVVVRLDSTNMNGYEWMLCVYIPEGSPVKERMIYASTREILKRQLGTSFFGDELFGTTRDELSLAAWKAHKTKLAVEQPLTSAEIQARQESFMEIAPGASKEYVHSVRFPLSAAASAAVAQYSSGQVNFVQLQVDPDKETIELSGSQNVDVNALANEIPENEPRFTLFTYNHTHNGEAFASKVFLYSCPPTSPVKLKMLYSTVKSAVTGQAEAQNIKIDKKVEVQARNEVSAQALLDELHVEVEVKPTTYSRPAAPGKGQRRLIRK